jgi:hypothetical protein
MTDGEATEEGGRAGTGPDLEVERGGGEGGGPDNFIRFRFGNVGRICCQVARFVGTVVVIDDKAVIIELISVGHRV